MIKLQPLLTFLWTTFVLVFSELKACVEAEEDCLGYQVESMITNISLELDCQQQDLVTLMMVLHFNLYYNLYLVTNAMLHKKLEQIYTDF